jgi:hypothetical protein
MTLSYYITDSLCFFLQPGGWIRSATQICRTSVRGLTLLEPSRRPRRHLSPLQDVQRAGPHTNTRWAQSTTAASTEDRCKHFMREHKREIRFYFSCKKPWLRLSGIETPFVHYFPITGHIGMVYPIQLLFTIDHTDSNILIVPKFTQGYCFPLA